MKKAAYPTPKLIPLDMSKAYHHQHPDINEKDTYLCLIDGNYFTGCFSKVWFGWSFDGWPAPLQYQARIAQIKLEIAARDAAKNKQE